MADKIKIEGVGPPWDGEHPLDIEEQNFNGWEARVMKQIAGLRPLEIQEALAVGDYDLIISLAVIALARNRVMAEDQMRDVEQLLLHSEMGNISFVTDEKEDELDKLPPASEPDSTISSEDSTPISGHSSSNDSGDLSEITPTVIGPRG